MIYNANKGDQFHVYLNGVLLRGIAWANDETGEYGQYYIGDETLNSSNKKKAHLPIKECVGDIVVVPKNKETEHEFGRRPQFLVRMIKKYGFTTGAEIGIARGNTTAYIIRNTNLNKYYAVDYWPGRFERLREKFYIRFSRELNRKKSPLELIELPSTEAAHLIEDESLDFIFIDADHSEEGAASDIVAWLPKLKTGGMMAGHDYNWTGVKRAVDREIIGKYDIKFWQADNIWYFFK